MFASVSLLCWSRPETWSCMTKGPRRSPAAPGTPRHPSGRPGPLRPAGSGRTCCRWGWEASCGRRPEKGARDKMGLGLNELRDASCRASRRTHLDHQVSLGVTGHPAELRSQLLELGPAVCVYHPACVEGEERSTDKQTKA